MRTNFTELSKFNKLRQDAISYMEGGFKKCDNGMIPIVKLLNFHESIAVRWCCESHPEAEKPKDHFYVAMAVKDQEGLDFVNAVYEKMIELMMAAGVDPFVELSVGFLYFDNGGVWRRWSIDAYTEINNKAVYLSSLESACRAILDTLPPKVVNMKNATAKAFCRAIRSISNNQSFMTDCDWDHLKEVEYINIWKDHDGVGMADFESEDGTLSVRLPICYDNITLPIYSMNNQPIWIELDYPPTHIAVVNRTEEKLVYKLVLR